VIEEDGSVRPCFFHPAIGNANQLTLEEAINSEAALNFRSRLDIPSNPTCQRCVCSLNYPR
jgi:Fe-coproporphyrin III synthase